MCESARIEVRGVNGYLRWSPRGYWSLEVGNFWGTEDLEEQFLDPEDGLYNSKAIEDAKQRLLTRARKALKKGK